MFKPLFAALVIALAALGSFAATAADDPSMHEIYEAANSGKLAAAQDMIATVLRDHPDSAKAHYVAAELDARQNKFGPARDQLQTAERLAPGLPFAKPDAVRALRSEIGLSSSGSASPSGSAYPVPAPRRAGISPGLLMVIVVLIGLVVWMIFRRRPVQQAPMIYPAGGNAYGPGYGGGYGAPGGGYPPAGGGIGSGIAGGLASGLAVGAGVVAGEALAHRLMDGGERERYADQPPERYAPDSNSNMGGEDFGVNDSSSWDDSSSADSGGGGDDWS
jgi:hypothetical protein